MIRHMGEIAVTYGHRTNSEESIMRGITRAAAVVAITVLAVLAGVAPAHADDDAFCGNEPDPQACRIAYLEAKNAALQATVAEQSQQLDAAAVLHDQDAAVIVGQDQTIRELQYRVWSQQQIIAVKTAKAHSWRDVARARGKSIVFLQRESRHWERVAERRAVTIQELRAELREIHC